ncbi:hypothetical protein KDL01_31395 [Actinospica durhamensis]|uniref:Uncharacterized protein n=1 Tax=Actinospica durhamensis TaxID=1508375 RepID=A0A941ITN1_9ACTN|nr:hypothetical protein [Actinospica durhamensis]MBR7837822.1 hypothetical protein [Actinospica durhamensis]
MIEDEARAVAAVAARCLTWSGWRRWEPVMRFGRLFTSGTHGDLRWGMMSSDSAGREACRLAMDSDLLYAEGYAGYPADVRAGAFSHPLAWAWCLDGENVVDPAADKQGTAFFGVALRPQYMRRVHESQRGDDGSEGFRWAFTRGDREVPPLDPATDIALDLGREIPSSVREWALTAEKHPGPARMLPEWVLAELLGTTDPGPAVLERYERMVNLFGADAAGPAPTVQNRFHEMFVRPSAPRQTPEAAPAGPYARFLVRHAEWFTSGVALQCAGNTGGVFSDDAETVGMIRDGDSLATLMRLADEHRPHCAWETSVTAETTEQPAFTPAEARLQANGHTFAVLRRLDYNAWDAWLRPQATDGEAAGVRLTRNGVSYEMALAVVFRAMGATMPTEFTRHYAGEQPDPTPYPPFTPTPELWAQPESRLPMTYERQIIRGLGLTECGQVAGTYSDATFLGGGIDGTSLAALIELAEENRPNTEWTLCPEDERADPELTVQKNAEVDLCWFRGGEAFFAALHRLDDGTWDAWLLPSNVSTAESERPVELLTPVGVSYELALTAIFRAMGDDMPTGFGLNYLNVRITPGLPDSAQA